MASVQDAAYEDKLAEAETKLEEMRNKLDDELFEHEKTMQREDKLDFRLAEVHKQLQTCQLEMAQANEGGASAKGDLAKVSKNKVQLWWPRLIFLLGNE